ncbi:DUF397 domain-containing protein [Nocardiopsis algeriensis]|uniref:DUF397 domain-containing protein n=1 Tax=Nocardiopsis algeriensis TaxID=1478215 RepID=A0A841IN63_9ACTN|nr:DUF397 domain-containing protein [Nocardiopsis algeriensis]MBB6119492.1 hypothetical protein [Nocardiopsis algeriensis]
MKEHQATEEALVSSFSWRTSSYSTEQGECVEVSEGFFTGVRDTKNRELGALFFSASEWQAFLGSARKD